MVLPVPVLLPTNSTTPVSEARMLLIACHVNACMHPCPSAGRICWSIVLPETGIAKLPDPSPKTTLVPRTTIFGVASLMTSFVSELLGNDVTVLLHNPIRQSLRACRSFRNRLRLADTHVRIFLHFNRRLDRIRPQPSSQPSSPSAPAGAPLNQAHHLL